MIANSNWLFCRLSPDRWPSLETPRLLVLTPILLQVGRRDKYKEKKSSGTDCRWWKPLENLSMLKTPWDPLWDCNRLQWLEMSVVISHGFNPFQFPFFKKTAMGNSAVEVCHFSCFDSPVFPWNPMFPLNPMCWCLPERSASALQAPGKTWCGWTPRAPSVIFAWRLRTTSPLGNDEWWWCLHGKSVVFYHGAVLKTESPKSSWIMLNPICGNSF